MDPQVRHRVLLSLRGERALGLRSVRAPRRRRRSPSADVPAVASPAPPPPPTPPPTPTTTMVELEEACDSPPPVVAGSADDATGGISVAAPFATLPLATAEKRTRLSAMDSAEVRCCTRCPLCRTRTQTVFGEGDVDAAIFFIGEGPGENEDLSGRPFVGRAGQLLDKMIGAMGLAREQVYIANIVKCRPPNNRVPAPDEARTCMPYLNRQLELVRPRAIVTLGKSATAYMLDDSKIAMGRCRGRWFAWRGIPLMPTFHPSYVLRTYTPQTRQAVWSDLQLVMEKVGLPLPQRAAP
jgi:uracil-DNA glycosylase family 4